MRISDWSSDVCSSDLKTAPARPAQRSQSPVPSEAVPKASWRMGTWTTATCNRSDSATAAQSSGLVKRWRKALARSERAVDRKSGVEGKGMSVSVELRGRRMLQKKNEEQQRENTK